MILAVCRVCLAYDTTVVNFINTPLQQVFENLLNSKMTPLTNLKVGLCCICKGYLQKFEMFYRKCLRSQEVLQQLPSNIMITKSILRTIDRKQLGLTHTLDITPPAVEEYTPYDYEYGDIGNPDTHDNAANFATYEETGNVDPSVIKNEIDLDGVEFKVEDAFEEEYHDIPSPVHQDVDNEDVKSPSDSDDDVPLKNLADKGDTSMVIDHKMRKKKEKVASSQVIILSQEEQLAEVLERSKSINYLESPYKCELCFKGFINLKAFQLHMGKHDKSSGDHACAVCQLRYKTERQLRAHVVACHSHIYKCSLCEYRAHTVHQAKEHDNWHKGFIFECKLCSKQFRKSSSYLTHIRTGHPSQHTCHICGAKVVSKHGLAMHMSKVHSDKTKTEANDVGDDTSCSVCGVRVSVYLLKSHLETHQDPSVSSVSCAKCGNSFKSHKKLRLHNIRVHLGIKYNKNVVCEVCGKKFPSNAALTYHQRTHTGEKPFACTVCSKRFASKNRLRTHFRVHSGEKPYNCTECSAKFSQKPALNRHFRIHTGDKPYICHLCSKSFTQSNSLRLHVRTVHLKMPSNYKKNKVQNCESVSEKIENNGLQSL